MLKIEHWEEFPNDNSSEKEWLMNTYSWLMYFEKERIL